MDDIRINSEVIGVLNKLSEETRKKIPNSVIDYLHNNSDETLIPKIDNNLTLKEMPISREAQAFVTMLNMLYFCETKEEKEAILKRVIENEKKKTKH